MSKIPSAATGWVQTGSTTQLPPGSAVKLQGSGQVGRGQAAYYDIAGSTGNVDLYDPAVSGAGLICAGVGDEMSELSDKSTTEGGAGVRLWQGKGSGQAGATAAGDAIVAGDMMVPVFDAGNGVPGKFSNSGGIDRPFLGVAFGLAPDGTPHIWAGPEASAMARTLHGLLSEGAALWPYAADATAATTQGTLTGGTALLTIGFVIPRRRVREIVTAVEIIPSAALALAITNFRVIQLWKVDTTGAVALAASPLVATFSTLTQNLVAGQPTAFTLGATAALTLRETDILVGTSVPTSAGATVPQSAIRALAKRI